MKEFLRRLGWYNEDERDDMVGTIAAIILYLSLCLLIMGLAGCRTEACEDPCCLECEVHESVDSVGVCYELCTKINYDCMGGLIPTNFVESIRLVACTGLVEKVGPVFAAGGWIAVDLTNTSHNVDTGDVCKAILFGNSNWVINSTVSEMGDTQSLKQAMAQAKLSLTNLMGGSDAASVGEHGKIRDMWDWSTNYWSGDQSGIKYFENEASLNFWGGVLQGGVGLWGRPSSNFLDVMEGQSYDEMISGQGSFGWSQNLLTVHPLSVQHIMQAALGQQSWLSSFLQNITLAFCALDAYIMMGWASLLAGQWMMGGAMVTVTGEELLAENANLIAHKVNTKVMSGVIWIFIAVMGVQFAVFGSVVVSPWKIVHAVGAVVGPAAEALIYSMDQYFGLAAGVNMLIFGMRGVVIAWMCGVAGKFTLEYLRV